MEVTKLSIPKWRDLGYLEGRIGQVGGRDVIVTHRNPANGQFWCEGLNNKPDADCWIDSEKVEIL